MFSTSPHSLSHFAQVIRFKPHDLSLFKVQSLRWASHFDPVVALDQGQRMGPAPQRPYPWMLALGAERLSVHPTQQPDALVALRRFINPERWTFLGLSYDLKNEIEPHLPQEQQPLIIDWPSYIAFEPQYLLLEAQGNIIIAGPDPAALLQQILAQSTALPSAQLPPPLPLMRKADYFQKVELLKAHIVAGDIYEANLCQTFALQNIIVAQPEDLFSRLQARANAPHSAYLRMGSKHLCSISPERYMARIGNTFYSQPIKGTAARHPHPLKDQWLAAALRKSEKDLAEHIMIVDLVRNDLARISEVGSVQVTELFGTYKFARVHQLISTISSRSLPHLHLADVLAASFPMGSMTGAPKIKAMALLSEYEQNQRGFYSGSIGFLAPNGDFDLNVVIRSWLIDTQTQTAALQVGGAIVFDSDPAAEYAECLLKMKGLVE